MKTIFFASAAPDAPTTFNRRMNRLQEHLFKLLKPVSDSVCADLVVVVVDEPSPKLMDIIRSRCLHLDTLRVFSHTSIKLDSVITAWIVNARTKEFESPDKRVTAESVALGYARLPNPIIYSKNDEIIGCVDCFARRHPPCPAVTRIVC